MMRAFAFLQALTVYWCRSRSVKRNLLNFRESYIHAVLGPLAHRLRCGHPRGIQKLPQRSGSEKSPAYCRAFLVIRLPHMRRIIVHLVRGEAGEAHEAMTRDLAEKFDSFPIHERIPPHLTLKRWFEADEAMLQSIYETLDRYAASHTQSEYDLTGFNHFGTGVIFVDVQPSEATRQNVRDLMADLHTVEGLEFDEFDDMEDDLHATVAMEALKPFDFDELWNYLESGPKPNFNMKFDNIAILARGDSRWEAEKVWELQ
jgi:2'-5' RNA ligase